MAWIQLFEFTDVIPLVSRISTVVRYEVALRKLAQQSEIFLLVGKNERKGSSKGEEKP